MGLERPPHGGIQRRCQSRLLRKVPDEDEQPTKSQTPAPPVPVVDPVEPLQVGLDRSFMFTKEPEEAGYSPAFSKP